MSDEPDLSPDRIARKPLVGVDETGAEHHFDRYEDVVYVLGTDGTVEHVEHLQPGELPAWIDYVADRRGWAECRYSNEDPFDALAIRLTQQLESTM